MKISKKLSLIFCGVLLIACSKAPTATLDINTTENFDFGWKFFAGEIANSENFDFDDGNWRDVNLPHDWSIEGNFSKNNPSFSRGGWLPTGKVAYRKKFVIPDTDKGKRIVIAFDGAYRNSEVYINGHLLGKRPFGYIAFHYDLTKHVNFGKENIVSVKLDNSNQPGSRWYTGTGIYRHVKLIKTNQVYIPIWGNYIIANNVVDNEALIEIETTINNDFNKDKDVQISLSVINPKGEKITEKLVNQGIKANQAEVVKTSIKITNPELWDVNSPRLYTVKTDIIVEGKIVYTQNKKTGIRTLEFNSNTGFAINGKTIKLKGVCLHHDGGPLGAAIGRRTAERQLEKLKEMGCNAVRMAHNPFSEEFMDVCDEMGMLVMNEAFDEWERPKSPTTVQDGKKVKLQVYKYAHHFKKWADRDLTDFILRDRNHPSVIMWSIGNEIDQMRDPEGAPIGKRLANIVHRLDYRPVTNGVHGYGNPKRPNQEAAATSDIYGYNYIKEPRLIKERTSFPNVKAVFTEHQSAQMYYPRSTYLYGKAKDEWWKNLNYKHNDAYNWVENSRGFLGKDGMEAWRLVKTNPYVMGEFIWTGWDYLGEVIPYGWPARSSSFGVIDLAGFPKDGYYFYQSQWSDKPMVHIFPHWNLEGMEGKQVTVYGYTNGDEVELFQDGKSLGKQTNAIEGVEYQSWNVVYKPGELRAVSYKNGKVIAEKIVRTAGVASKIKMETRRTEMLANGQDLIYVECTIQDKDGNEVPTANNLLKFKIEGSATIAGVGNGNNMGLEPFKANKRSAFNGKCLAIIKSTKKAGNIKLTVSANGLESSTINLIVK
ncbi:beta-galactosidase GalB [Postechiella marina]|uniref:Beta-galactosidase GalB n=1 Tax=Postechiella marina TaxID=943941 RepID=A0ABP8CBV2_9FLAO